MMGKPGDLEDGRVLLYTGQEEINGCTFIVEISVNSYDRTIYIASFEVGGHRNFLITLKEDKGKES